MLTGAYTVSCLAMWILKTRKIKGKNIFWGARRDEYCTNTIAQNTNGNHNMVIFVHYSYLHMQDTVTLEHGSCAYWYNQSITVVSTHMT